MTEILSADDYAATVAFDLHSYDQAAPPTCAAHVDGEHYASDHPEIQP